MRALAPSWALLGLAVASSHCRGVPAPSVTPQSTVSAPTPPLQASARVQGVSSAAPLPSSSPPSTTAAPQAPSTATAPLQAPQTLDEPPLLAPDGSPLPQTDERPSVTSERFQRRMAELAAAILANDPERAKATFFPLVAYTQVKDVKSPERDYRYRLLAHFERDVRQYHRELGPDAEAAQFASVTVPEARAAWMPPGKEGNRLGYFRVLRSQLHFRWPNGKERSLELTSLISWRGEWYVVHLHGFE